MLCQRRVGREAFGERGDNVGETRDAGGGARDGGAVGERAGQGRKDSLARDRGGETGARRGGLGSGSDLSGLSGRLRAELGRHWVGTNERVGALFVSRWELGKTEEAGDAADNLVAE
jgi:hypothetical protein